MKLMTLVPPRTFPRGQGLRCVISIAHMWQAVFVKLRQEGGEKNRELQSITGTFMLGRKKFERTVGFLPWSTIRVHSLADLLTGALKGFDTESGMKRKLENIAGIFTLGKLGSEKTAGLPSGSPVQECREVFDTKGERKAKAGQYNIHVPFGDKRK